MTSELDILVECKKIRNNFLNILSNVKEAHLNSIACKAYLIYLRELYTKYNDFIYNYATDLISDNNLSFNYEENIKNIYLASILQQIEDFPKIEKLGLLRYTLCIEYNMLVNIHHIVIELNNEIKATNIEAFYYGELLSELLGEKENLSDAEALSIINKFKEASPYDIENLNYINVADTLDRNYILYETMMEDLYLLNILSDVTFKKDYPDILSIFYFINSNHELDKEPITRYMYTTIDSINAKTPLRSIYKYLSIFVLLLLTILLLFLFK